jgi:flagellar protein FlgJ
MKENFNIVNNKAKKEDTSKFEDILKDKITDKDKEELKDVCDKLESQFINLMFKEMRKGSQNPLIPKSQTEEMFQGMIDEEYSKRASESDGFGLSKMMYDQLIRKTIQ